jgi:outer membrane murein-binding lipoprotein Lpp
MPDPTQIAQAASSIDTTTPSGIVAAIGIAIAGLGVGGLQLRKMWRGDNTDAKNTAREQAYLDDVSARVKELEAKVEKLTEEKIAAEIKAVRLEAQVETLNTKIKHIEEEKEAIRKLLKDVEEKYTTFREENFTLRNNLQEVKSQLIVAEAKIAAVSSRPEMSAPLGITGGPDDQS